MTPQQPITLSARPAKETVPLDRYQLLRIIQAMADAVVVFDPKGQILLWNLAFENMIGADTDAISGKTLKSVFQSVAPDLASEILAFVQAGTALSEDITIKRHHQKKMYKLQTIPIDESGALSEGVAVFHDITEVKQKEKMRRDFVANVSHELRTPLSAINGYAETLLEGALEDKAVAQEFVTVIFNHTQRLSRLVRDLLDLSKLESAETPFELLPIELIPIISSVIQLHQKDYSAKEINVSFQPPLVFPKVYGHASSIEQVVTNLLDNAIKYTPAGGAISIETQVTADGFVQVNVRDTGIGIESKHISRLFERFYRVDKARSRDLGGTGLGLSIVKHIIQLHGGDVWVKSTPGQGTDFCFTLRVASK